MYVHIHTRSYGFPHCSPLFGGFTPRGHLTKEDNGNGWVTGPGRHLKFGSVTHGALNVTYVLLCGTEWPDVVCGLVNSRLPSRVVRACLWRGVCNDLKLDGC